MPPLFSQFRRFVSLAVSALIAISAGNSARAALLAYEPFTNTPGANIIGSSDGSGFSGVWQSNSSQGVATNTSYGLSYTDGDNHTLLTAGGAGFFQGLTTGSSAMQPLRLFDFSRGTNGADGTTTWISFLVARQGPTGTLSGNPYGRGANVDHDFNAGALQKLAIGNSSGVGSNTVALIPQGSAANCRGDASSTFGGVTNFVVVRIDHVMNGNDSAWLFVNPVLGVEPSISAAGAFSTNSFDFSFDRLRVFAGGTNSASQPCAEMVLDEYRVGETYADVTPHVGASGPQTLLFTNVQMSAGSLILSGTGGTSGGNYRVLAGADLSTASTNWPAVMTNQFDAEGNFICTNPVTPGLGQFFFRLQDGDVPPPPPVAPGIVAGPTNFTVSAGETAGFSVAANGTAPLDYQWFFNTNTLLDGMTSSNLTITGAQWSDAGGYSVRISNTAGAVTSSVAILTVLAPPAISDQPQSQEVSVSNAVSFSVTATGTAPLHYQWFFQTNTPLPAATNDSCVITTVRSSDAGGYTVVVTNNYGAVTSLVATLNVAAPVVGPVYYVATNGSDSNPGTNIAAPFKTIAKGLTAVGNGGLVYVRGGVYALSSKLSLSKTASPTNPVRLWAYTGETPVIDSTGNSSDGVSISGDCYHLKGITVMNAGHNGINISGASNVVEFCTTCSNSNTGIHITGDTNTSYNLVLNCDSFRNYDAPTHGQNADGFSAKWIFGPGNVFSGCRAWENADDGWDLWMGTNTIVITNCWAFRQGTNVFGDPAWEGNGNGFKLGGNYVGTPHRLVRSVAFENMANGVDQNNNLAGQTLDNNTCWANRGRNFAMAHGVNTTPHIVRNNISFGAGSSDSFASGTLSTNNSWQIISSPAVNAGDVQSVDDTLALLPRNADGSLPDSAFLHPVPGGRLVNQGVDTGDPYLGSAPDLGAFEVR